MVEQSLLDHRPLAAEPVPAHARSRAGESCATAEQRTGDRGRGCRIADTHFAKNDQIGVVRNLGIASVHRTDEFGLAHGRRRREIGRGPVQFQRRHAELGAARPGELVNGGPTRLEICHHLRRHLGRIGGNTLSGDAVVAGKNKNLTLVEGRRVTPLPGCKPGHEFLEPAERARRLGQLRLARRRRLGGRRIGPRQLQARGAELIEGGKLRHFSVGSGTAYGEIRISTAWAALPRTSGRA